MSENSSTTARPCKQDQIPLALRSRPQWCNWDPNTKKPTPAVNHPLLPFVQAWALDPDHIGFHFTSSDPYGGVDIDARSELGGRMLAMARDLGAYIERSPGGSGRHIMGRGVLARGLGKSSLDGAVEAYSSGRYFTMTGKGEGDPDVDIQPLFDELEAYAWAKRGPGSGNGSAPTPGAVGASTNQQHSWTDADAVMLNYISPEDYQTWVEVGMALKDAGADYSVWARWSAQSGKWPGDGEGLAKWSSFTGTGVTLGTVVHLARLGGYGSPGSSNGAVFGPAQSGGAQPQSQPPKQLELFSWGELAKKARPPDYLVDGMLERGQIGLVVAHRGSGKTFFLLDLAAHVVAGKPWFGRKTKAGKVLYLSAEGPLGFLRRVLVFEQNKFVPGVNFRGYLGALSLGAGKNDPQRVTQDAQRVIATIQQEQPDLVVVDTASQYKGDVEENSNSEVAQFLALMRRYWLGGASASLLLAHHTPKDQSQTGRGAGAWEDNTDLTMYLEVAAPGVVKVNLPRMRDGVGFETHFRLVSSTAQSPDGPISSAIVEHIDDAQRARARRQEIDQEHQRALAAVRAALRPDGWAEARSVWRELGAQTKTSHGDAAWHFQRVHAVLGRMAEEGLVWQDEEKAARSTKSRAIYRPAPDLGSSTPIVDDIFEL